MANTSAILSTAFLPPVHYYATLIKYQDLFIEQHEHFVKQTYRNRCCIYSPNGILILTVPLEKRSERTITKDIRISYAYNWQNIHWRSLESAYRCSPFFEFYEDGLVKFYEEKRHVFLIDLNEELFHLMNTLMKLKPNIKRTEKYKKEYTDVDDFRNTIAPRENSEWQAKPYKQVFDNKHGFIPGLSIIDLLFNQGPASEDFL